VTASPGRVPSSGTVRVLADVRQDMRCERTLAVPESSEDWLAGHFPGFPVVPGFVQLGWVIDAAQDLVGRALVVRRLDALKFHRLLRPLDVVHLTVEIAASRTSVSFRVWNASHVFSSGRLVFDGSAP
jgi:3-hydroxymyristoyl/3-hydroxydecanoyl-(acyl carrier protein) dehydratase